MTLNELFGKLSPDFRVRVTDMSGNEKSGLELQEGGWNQEIEEIRPDDENPHCVVVVLL